MSDNKKMLREIEMEVEYTRSMIGRSALDSRVMQAMKLVPRHEFVPIGARHEAYYNGPLPIGHGQTISQPYIVALMTDLLEPTADDVVLEVGTGSGYQAAVLSRVLKQVYSLEIIEALSIRAAETLRRLGYTNVECRAGDGYEGWPEHAPFDGIIVTCAPTRVPKPLEDQLAEGGRMVIPVGEKYDQRLLLLTKENGVVKQKKVVDVRFVPMVDKQGKTY